MLQKQAGVHGDIYNLDQSVSMVVYFFSGPLPWWA